MTFKELMMYFEYSHRKAALAIGVTVTTIGVWKKENKIPWRCQCAYQVISGGELKADKKED